jgi:hypothetical protein
MTRTEMATDILWGGCGGLVTAGAWWFGFNLYKYDQKQKRRKEGRQRTSAPRQEP